MLELFIGLSIDFILVKSWWFDKAKLIERDQLWCWPLGRWLKVKKNVTNKNAPKVFLN